MQGGSGRPGMLRQAASEMLLLLKELMRSNALEEDVLKAEIPVRYCCPGAAPPRI